MLEGFGIDSSGAQQRFRDSDDRVFIESVSHVQSTQLVRILVALDPGGV